MQVTSKPKFVEKTAMQKAVCPRILFLPFFSKKICMTVSFKPLKIAAEIIFISRKIYLDIHNFKITLTTRKKCKVNMVHYFCSSVYYYGISKISWPILIKFYIYHQWDRGKAVFTCRFWSRFHESCGCHGNISSHWLIMGQAIPPC